MPSHAETRILLYTADLMYAVVADVEKYPEFLPWCHSLRVLQRERTADGETLLARIEAGFGAMRDSFVSRVTLAPKTRGIDVVQARGPFRRLENRWRFAPAGEGAKVAFSIVFEFRNPLLNALASGALEHEVRRISDAFEARAKQLSARREA
jgi:coenzyme Q-binding protein COQ10